jgi:YD repeat-containing protein
MRSEAQRAYATLLYVRSMLNLDAEEYRAVRASAARLPTEKGTQTMWRKKLLTTTALVLTMTATATAQSFALPSTVQIEGPDGQKIGTATTSGNMTVYRDAKGQLTGSSTIATDGTRTHYDPHGKITGTSTVSGNVMTNRDAAGEITGTITTEGNARTIRDAAGQLVGKMESRK